MILGWVVARIALAVLHAAFSVALLLVVVGERAPEVVLLAFPIGLIALGLMLSWRWVRWLAFLGAMFAGLLVVVFGMAILWPEEQVHRLQLACSLAAAVEIATFVVASRVPKRRTSDEPTPTG